MKNMQNTKEKKKRCLIYNKSSEKMNEVPDGSVNLIVTSPPFNDGLMYGGYLDKCPLDQYLSMMRSVIHECARTLTSRGIMIIEAADTIISDGKFIQLAGLLQRYCLDVDLNLVSRHINFIDARGCIELPTHTGNSYYNPVETDENHSNCCQWLVFSKKKRPFRGGKISYISYERPTNPDDHHCPFPEEIIDRFLEIGNFQPGNVVLDPFMGTGRLGEKIIERGGYYIGYEIDEGIFKSTKNSLLDI
jgi:modification methylase